MLDQMLYLVTGISVLAGIYVIFFKQEIDEIMFASLGVSLSVTMFVYVLFSKFILIYGEVVYAISCVITFYSIELSVKTLLSIIKRQKLERELSEIKKQKFNTS